MLVGKDHALRGEVEQFIRENFYQKYNAELRSFANELFCARSINGGLVGAFALTRASETNLYAEQYLDEDIAEFCSKSVGHQVYREDIVEIGNVSLTSTKWFVPLMRAALRDNRAKAKWAIFTATQGIKGLLSRERVYPQVLMTADQTKLTDLETCWGDYYRHKPCVFLVSLNRLRRQFEEGESTGG
jgi:hypothetical protein